MFKRLGLFHYLEYIQLSVFNNRRIFLNRKLYGRELVLSSDFATRKSHFLL